MIILPHPPRTCSVFCDETAQAGPNWLDPKLFYITAAWIVRDEYLSLFRQKTTELRDQLKLQGEQRELKGRDFRSNKKRQMLALEWFRMIRNDGVALGYPVYYIIERKFGACGKMVDLLLDPYHNESADWLPVSDIERREEVTEILYEECPPQVLAAFCEALFRPSEASWSNALAQVAAVSWSGETLCKSLKAASEMASELYDVEFGYILRQGKNPALPHSPNYFSFRHLLQSCDVAIENMWPGCKAAVVHDEQIQYKEYFDDLYKWVSGVGVVERQRGVRLPRLIGGLHSISEFRLLNSKEEVGIQAADLLAWTIYQVIGSVCGDPSTPGLAKQDEVFDEIIGPFLMCDRNARMHASWKMKEKMWERAFSIQRSL